MSSIHEFFPNSKLTWIKNIFEYAHNYQGERFKMAMENALHIFFPENHQPITPGANEQDTADGRFFDFFIFEYRDKLFDHKTLLEYVIENASLSSEDREYLKTLQKYNIYSFFRILKINKHVSWSLKDMVSGEIYEVKENLGTLNTEEHGLIIYRIYLDEEGDWRMAPGFPSFIDPVMAIPFIHMMERKRGHMKKKEIINALTTELMLYTEKESPDFRASLNFEAEQERVISFMKKYQSAYSYDEFKELVYGDDSENTRNFLVELIRSCKKKPTKKDIDCIITPITNVLNRLPRNTLNGESPYTYQNEYPQGPIERSLKEDFNQTIALYISENELPNTSIANHIAQRFQKIWLSSPQVSLGGLTPMEAIIEERKKAGNPDQEFGLDFFVDYINGSKSTNTPLEKIDVSQIEFLHDILFFLEYLQIQKNEELRLTPKRNCFKNKDFYFLTGAFKRNSMICCIAKNRVLKQHFQDEYLNFILKVCELAGLIYDLSDTISLKKNVYHTFLKKEPAAQVLDLFNAWYFSDIKHWAFLLNEDEYDDDDLQSVLFYAHKDRESVLARLSHIEDKITLNDLLWQFYGSKRDILEKNLTLFWTIKNGLVKYILQHFDVFGLIRFSSDRNFDSKKTFILPEIEYVELTKAGEQLLPYIIEELFARNLDGRAVKHHIEDFLKMNEGGLAPDKSLRQPKVGRNDPCPCGSGKKFKKCCDY